MLKIYLCEDMQEQREKISKMIENTVMIEDLDMQLCCVSENPHVILDKIKETKEVGLYFLDIDLNSDISGLQLAQEIRKYDPRGFIVFVTTHSEMSYMTFIYKLEALDFILKDDEENLGRRVRECILKANQRFASINNKVQTVFSVKVNDKVYTIDYDDILFFETSPNVHKIVLHCKNRTMEFLGKIKDVEKNLDERFYRCHRSFLVNKDNIKEVDLKNRILYMVDGQECMIASRLIRGLNIEGQN